MVKYLVFSVIFLSIAVLGLISQNDGLFAAGVASSSIYTVGNMLRTDLTLIINKKENK